MAIKESDFKDVIEYYDHTRFDYKIAWDNSPTPAVHFGFYDEHSSNHSDALMNTNRVLAEVANIKQGEKVLDAGCGKGGSCFWLAINKQVEVTGITPVQSQINDCNTQAEVLNLKKQTSFVLADYCNTPFEDQSFDVVWACESLCHAKDKAIFYQEAYRILKPGGRLIIAEYIRNDRPLTTNGEALLASWLNRWAIDDLDTKEEHLSHATKAGFQNIHIQDVTKNVRTSLRNLYNNSRKWLWFSIILKFFRIRSGVQHANMFASIKQYEALEEKLWFYAFISAVKK
jgi:cyclopropane fatty-acyl-phospholipid synthase-like methyltransferase